jgi:rhodanese-related sulfurtransferase
MNTKTITLLCLGLLSVAALLFVTRDNQTEPQVSQKQISTMNAPDFQKYLESESAVIIDVRTPEEFASGHIENSINIDFYSPEFYARISALDPTQEYAIYCRSGNRSSEALRMMGELNFTKVTELSGGMLAWERNNLKVCSESLSC